MHQRFELCQKRNTQAKTTGCFFLPIIYSCIVLVIAVIVGLVLVFSATLIPLSKNDNSIITSSQILSQEGKYPKYDFGFQDDNWTNAVMFLVAVENGNTSVSLTERAMHMPFYINSPDINPILSLDLYVKNDFSKLTTLAYGRYWCGYVVWLKPLLALGLDLSAIRNILVLTFVLSLAVCLYCLTNTAKSGRHLMILLLPLASFLIITQAYRVVMNLEFNFIYTFLPLVIAFVARKRFFSYAELAGVFTLVAAVTNYFDYLTSPLLTLTLPLLYMYLTRSEDDGLTSWKILLVACLAWGFGYFGMWIAKVLVSLPFVGKQVLDEFISSFTLHEGLKATYIETLFLNLSYYYKSTVLVILPATALTLTMTKWKDLHIGKHTLVTLLCIIATCTTPLAWLLVFTLHSNMHYWFTYRTFCLIPLCLVFVVSYIAWISNARTKEQ